MKTRIIYQSPYKLGEKVTRRWSSNEFKTSEK